MLNLIPYPAQLKPLNEQFVLTRDVDIYAPREFLRCRDYTLGALRRLFTGYGGRIIESDGTESTPGAISYVTDKSLKAEAYRLEIGNDGITLFASGRAGFYYADITLSMLIPRESGSGPALLDGVIISDEPEYEFRGFLLDESRHFFGAPTVKRILDIMAYNKLNKFIWHLTDDQGYRVESKYYPELNKIGSKRHDTQLGGWRGKQYSGKEHGGYYTREQIIDIVSYAEERNIEVIPELDLPCHTGAIIASIPELSAKERAPVYTNFNARTLFSLTSDRAFSIITNIIDEWSALFPSGYIHLGGDYSGDPEQLFTEEMREYAAAKGLGGARELFSDFFNRLNAYISRASGKKIIVRDSAYSHILDSDIIVQIYQGDKTGELMKEAGKGRKVITAPANAWHFDYPYALTPLNATYRHKPPLQGYDSPASESVKNVIGGIASLWTEWIYDSEKIDFNCNPRLAAVAERMWNGNQSYRSFIERFYSSTGFYDDMQVAYAKAKMVLPGAYRRVKDSYLWLSSDQYSEVRLNRKK